MQPCPVNITLSLNVAVTYLLAPGAHPSQKDFTCMRLERRKGRLHRVILGNSRQRPQVLCISFSTMLGAVEEESGCPSKVMVLEEKIKVNINTEI